MIPNNGNTPDSNRIKWLASDNWLQFVTEYGVLIFIGKIEARFNSDLGIEFYVYKGEHDCPFFCKETNLMAAVKLLEKHAENLGYVLDKKTTKYEFWTDGACSGNPGPGGWAWAAKDHHNQVYSDSGFDPKTTNNRMELKAIYEALKSVADQISPSVIGTEVTIHTDSEGAICWLTRRWQRNTPKIITLCEAIEQVIRENSLSVDYVKVKGHSGDPMNEFVDKLAVKAYKDQ